MSAPTVHQIIRQAHVSEKSAQLNRDHNYYVFQVASTATKPQIKRVIEDLFNVKVATVRTVNMPRKTLKNRWGSGQGRQTRKAYVRLVAGQTIDMEGMAL